MLLRAKRRSHLTYLKHIEGNTNNVVALSHLPSSSSTLSTIDASGYSLISSSCLSNNSAASSSRDLKVLRNSNDDQVKECTNDNSNKYDPSTSLMRKVKRKFKFVSKVDIAVELIAMADQTPKKVLSTHSDDDNIPSMVKRTPKQVQYVDSSDSKKCTKSAMQDIKEELSSLPCEITIKEEEKYSIFLCNDMIYEILSFFTDYQFIVERCVFISKQWYNVIRAYTFEMHFNCISISQIR